MLVLPPLPPPEAPAPIHPQPIEVERPTGKIPGGIPVDQSYPEPGKPEAETPDEPGTPITERQRSASQYPLKAGS